LATARSTAHKGPTSLSPLLATALLAEYGSPYAVAGYMVAMAMLSTACAFGLRPLRAGA